MPDRIEIIITPDADEQRRRRRKRIQKDIGSRRRVNEPLPRRLRQQSGLINFWDLGQKRSGETWADLTYKTLSFTGTTGPLGTIRAVTPTLSNWNSQQAEIFAVPIEQWKTQFRKFGYEDGERYGLDLVDPEIGDSTIPVEKVFSVGRTNSRLTNAPYEAEPEYIAIAPISGVNWLPGGLSVPPGSLSAGPGTFGFHSGGAFIDFGFGQPWQKCTLTPDVNAPAVDFTLALGQSINVYLFPRLCAHVLTYVVETGASGVVGPFKQLSRSLWLNMQADTPGGSWGSINVPLLSNSNSSQFTLTGTKANAVANQILTYPGSRGFTVVGGSISDGATVSDLAQFHSEEQGVMFETIAFSAVDVFTGYPPGLLSGVIEQQGQFYYFWTTDYPPFPIGVPLSAGKLAGLEL